MTVRFWTSREIINHFPELRISKGGVENHMRNGELRVTRHPVTKTRRARHEDVMIYVGKWWLVRNGLPGWVSAAELSERCGQQFSKSLPARVYDGLPSFKVFSTRFFWEKDAEEALTHYGRFGEVIEMREPRGDQCLRAGCGRKGNRQPEGYGFRFCDEHLPAWWEVRDRPRGTASAPQSQVRGPQQLTLGVA